MARVLHQRRNAAGMARILHRLMGIDQKMKQYEVGERFINNVVSIGGFSALDSAWRSPESLPTLAELDGRAWLRRRTHSGCRLT